MTQQSRVSIPLSLGRMELVVSSVLNNTSALLAAGSVIASTYGIEGEIIRLERNVELIRDVLVDAEHKQLISNQFIQLWLMKIKAALLEADDLLDEFHTQLLRRKRDAKGIQRDFCSFLSCHPFVFRHKFARIRTNIREQLRFVTENLLSLDFKPKGVVGMEYVKSTFVLQEDIVGREENVRDIIDLLLNHNHDDGKYQNVSLVAIVGPGGIGKTALAQLVYNNAHVKQFFEQQMWVCVSEFVDVKSLVKEMLESLLDNEAEADDQPLESLQMKLQQSLDGKRNLLVLDDVRNADRERWLHLKDCLMCGAHGSKILVTTRSQTVVDLMDVKTPYVLPALTNFQSWTLLNRLAFDQDQMVSHNLDNSLSQKIVEKCAGVPLAIRIVGSLLRSSTSLESECEAILKEVDFGGANDSVHNLTMSMLKLNYDTLPVELKQCFVYFSLFPKGWKYEKNVLIDLWMAQGFLKDKNGNKCLEDVGEEYVRILLEMKFIQELEMDELGEIKYFEMHDSMHDFSLSIAMADSDLYLEGKEIIARLPTHASFKEYNPGSSTFKPNLRQLRSFIEVNKNYQRDPSVLFVFRRLRSLDLSSYKMRRLPASIGEMIHLRYLNLSCSELSSLPYSISNLVNLQTLILSFCLNLNLRGDMMTKLISLRRLDIQGCMAFEGLCKMTSLQRLPYFTVAKDRESAKLNELKDLNLRGGLTIQCLGSVMNVEQESKDVNLTAKENLISLTLKWGPYSEKKNNNPEELLDNLRPPQNLKSLTIEEYPGGHLSDWLSSCKNLVRLRFFDIRNCLQLTVLEGLKSLKTLHIERMDSLEHIHFKGLSSSNIQDIFPSLEELKIRRCQRLIRWEYDDKVVYIPLPPFPCLSSLQINRCSELKCMPTFPDLVDRLELAYSSTKPLLDTLDVSTVGPSTSTHVAASLSKLKSLHIEGIEIEELPKNWMQHLSSLEHLSIASFSSPEVPLRHMQYLTATLKQLTIRGLHSWHGNENYGIQIPCLSSLQVIRITSCLRLVTLPKWICHLQSLQFIYIQCCENLESFPEEMHHLTSLKELQVDGAPVLKERCNRETGAEWPKIAHIPDILFDLDEI